MTCEAHFVGYHQRVHCGLRRGFKGFVVSIGALTASALPSIPHAVADPPNASTSGGAHITDLQHANDRWDKVSVYSPAMDKVVVNDVLKAPRSGAPTFYLLPGIDGGDNPDPGADFAPGTKSWFGFTDVQGFFAKKNVNVVSPLGGAFSWYTDWVNDRSKPGCSRPGMRSND
jgi:diacylglycerol O-acyltransferase/trehalose O-mycolyltransferase